jgi:hypothetical protein
MRCIMTTTGRDVVASFSSHAYMHPKCRPETRFQDHAAGVPVYLYMRSCWPPLQCTSRLRIEAFVDYCVKRRCALLLTVGAIIGVRTARCTATCLECLPEHMTYTHAPAPLPDWVPLLQIPVSVSLACLAFRSTPRPCAANIACGIIRVHMCRISRYQYSTTKSHTGDAHPVVKVSVSYNCACSR